MILIGADLALLERLQRDEHACRYSSSCLPPLPVKAITLATAGSALTMSTKLRNPLPHRLKRGVLVALNAANEAAGVLLRKKSFGHDDEQIDIHADREQENTSSVKAGWRSTTCKAAFVQAQYPVENFARSPDRAGRDLPRAGA